MDNNIQNIGNITPPNWSGDVDKRYLDFFNDYFYKEVNEFARKNFGDVYYPSVNGVITFRNGVNVDDLIKNFSTKNRKNLRESESGINIFKIDDSLVIHAHGNKKGKILFGDKTLVTPNRIVEFLESNNRISPDIKKIYTLSCYGGTQESFVSSGGRPVKSAHTSKAPIHAAPYVDKDGTNSILLSMQEKEALDKDFSELIKKEKAIVYDDSIFENFENWNNAQNQKLTSRQARDKYVKDPSNIPDEFYTSQGLDPKLQKNKLQELNKRQPKPEIQVATEDIKLEKFEEETKKLTEDTEKLLKELSEEEAVQVGPITNKVVEKAAKDVNKAVKKDVNKAVKNTLKPVKLSGKGKAAIGVAIALGIGAVLSNKNTREMPKQEESPRVRQKYTQQYSSGIEQQIAKDMSSYKYGKHITGFINF